MESIRYVIASLTDANPTDDIEVEKLQLGQLMSRITNILSLQCIVDELVTQVQINMPLINTDRDKKSAHLTIAQRFTPTN